MTMLILGFLIGIYIFARKSIKNEPLKTQLEQRFDNLNKSLSVYKDKKPYIVLNYLSGISNRLIFYILTLTLLSLIFPKRVQSVLIMFFGSMLILTMSLSFSINWIQNHKKSLKEYFLNFPMICFMFSPLFFYYFGQYPIPNIEIKTIFKPCLIIIDSIGIINFQIIWLIGGSFFFYLGAFLLATPLYLTIYTLIFMTAIVIKTIEKYIDYHILDAIVAIISLIMLYIKIFI